MLSGYAQNRFAEEAMGQFDETMNSKIQPNVTTCVAVISSCSSLGEPCLAQSLVKMLDEKHVHLNYFIKTALLDKYAKCRSLETAREIFDELGVHKNSAAWNAMISDYTRVGGLIAGYAQNGQSAMALELFQEMAVTKDLKPDEVNMVSVLLSAYGHLGALELGKWVVNFITESQIKLCVSGFNYLIFMYPKCGSMSDARQVFQEMATRDVVSYNTLIRGFAAHGHGSEALELTSKMKDEGIEPDRITYIGVLMACSHGGLLEEGRKIFESIKNPAVDHYACMVDLLGPVGKLDEENTLIERMLMNPRAGV
ncbi:Pentatricopeptide repeat-containing protein [Actinidia chinensis var. chinensis]|uniref:Pentatricopeptide repeat-containing protein n=1 Tax=Actinidia chinensis var. chinensis TaxID=1590841 RepID=A0A2R6R6M8_ACTCC|nr:Pentatricopeptide repeat-containing protein [Actinidia chinensis var. chinensis]